MPSIPNYFYRAICIGGLRQYLLKDRSWDPFKNPLENPHRDCQFCDRHSLVDRPSV